jgi:non-specific serine/threonine protein kinase
VGAHRHNLPIAVTSFVGREQELAEVETRLSDVRVLTLTGVGGCGKTRLALEVARAVMDQYVDGVWLVELGPLTDPELVPDTVAAVLGTPKATGESVTSTVVGALRPLRLLLVVDNCEHLLDASARLVGAVVRSCPDVRVLATSREPLGIAGETAWRVPSLPTPDPHRLPALPELERTAAVRLFVERARAVEPHFELTQGNAAAVAQICKRLDGIPLALELAAARVRALTVEHLVVRLDQRFLLLTGGSRSALPRQQTLRATLDWSYELLDAPERALFRRLAVFVGGWTLEAAEAVAQGEPIEADDVLDTHTSLIDKSLVIRNARGVHERYSFLETVRQYAEDHLLRAGEAVSVRNRHLDWCLDQASNLTFRSLPTPDRGFAELDNVRAAMAWSASDNASAGAGVLLLVRLGLRWSALTPSFAGGRRWVEMFLAAAPAPNASRASALLVLDHTLRHLHEFELAGRAAEEALAIYRELGDERGIAEANSHLGMVEASRGRYASGLSLVEQALASARERDDRIDTIHRLRDIGVISIAAGDLPKARAALSESADLARDVGPFVHPALLRLAIVDRLEGNNAAARARLDEVSQLRGPQFGFALPRDALFQLEEANLARAEGRFDVARTSILEVLRQSQAQPETGLSAEAVARLGMCEIAAGSYARGVTLLATASNVEGPLGTIHLPDLRFEAPIYLGQARTALGDVVYASAWTEGHTMTLDQARAYALEDWPEDRAPHLT